MPNEDPYSTSFTVPDGLRVDGFSFDGGAPTTHASTAEDPEARCLLCGRPSRRVHGR